ncbi:MAG: hypothetical protein MUF68_02835 [Cyclobacteriaceae bacterium]|jgi:hypothetical protein|nr:hypothetical protein [Cyclobacteriaceae bacterium]
MPLCKIIFLVVFVLLSITSIAQKNVVAVSQSELIKITLPAGAKQDKRIFPVAAAQTALELEAQDHGIVLENSPEILTIPTTNKQAEQEILNNLSSAGFAKVTLPEETDYFLLNHISGVFMVYMNTSRNETLVYITRVRSVPNGLLPVYEINNANPSRSNNQAEISKNEIVSETTEIKKEIIKQPENTNPPTKTSNTYSDGFYFVTTNFDDGWIANVQPEFVSVTKEGIYVKLIYPEKYPDNLQGDISDFYWNRWVTPFYRISNAQKLNEGFSYFKVNFIEGAGIENGTNKNVYVGISVIVTNGICKGIIVAAPSKEIFYQYFKEPEALQNMLAYNKFAVSANDLVGEWTESSSAGVNLYNVYTGGHAGMNYASSTDHFEFKADGTYTSKHSGASSVYGTTTTYNQKYTGKATISNWGLIITNRFKNATEDFWAQFEVIKGGRILRLQNKESSAIIYSLIKIK